MKHFWPKRTQGVALVAALGASVAFSTAATANPFAPPGSNEERAIASPSENESSSAPNVHYPQHLLERIYKDEITDAIIRRSSIVSRHGNGRRLLYEPTVDCYLEQVDTYELVDNLCWQRIKDRWYIHQDGSVEYPVLERPRARNKAENTSAIERDAPAILADPANDRFADMQCERAYNDMHDRRNSGASIVSFENATEAMREGFRRVPSNEC
ncbi:hypothetical protein [Vreelandella massiliensis]|uniref:hypothetical protein n=1 Tax=Vreelandella massiliensis TaxID=1816686 RepID=UPI00096A54C1|nr:hypothetical protein [Halomonas massiliensis]